MDREKPTGFTLFPQPPTPPTRRSRLRAKSASSNGSTKLVKNRSASGPSHARKPSTSTVDQADQPGLIPAPLKIRRAVEDVPPLPTWIPPSGPPKTPTKTKQFATQPKTPDSAPPQLPAIPDSSPFDILPRTPQRHDHIRSRSKLTAIAEFVELEAEYQRPSSRRLSQWLDLEDGGVDRRRLSMYLGSVLDNTFQVPTFEPGTRGSITLSRRVSRLEMQSLIERCACPPDTIICQCSSSPEFERFRSWSHHKQNISISSTACLVGVPRARFQSAFFRVPEPSVAELPSTPGLFYDTEEDASECDWATPKTPSRDDVFDTPSPSGKWQSSRWITPSHQSSSSSTPSKLHSFSRPFRPDSTYLAMSSEDSAPSTPSRSQSRSTKSKFGFLTSISTMSSFDFDFDAKSRRQSLLKLQQSEGQSLPQLPTDREQSHLRTDSNESFTSQASQYELSTATARVAMSSSSIKPILVTNTPKRTKNLSSTSRSTGSTSTSSSAKSSTSSFSVPDYWRRFDAGLRTRSRSTTLASNATNESAAFSAMLTTPLLSPKGAVPKMEHGVVNTPAQRANTTKSMPLLASNEFSQFDFGTDGTSETKPKSVLENTGSLGRSNTTPNLITSISSSTRGLTQTQSEGYRPVHCNESVQGQSNDDNAAQFDDQVQAAPDNNEETQLEDHVQAHLNANARLRAYFEANTPTGLNSHPQQPPQSDQKVGLGLISTVAATTEPTSRRKKSFISTDDQDINRDDSGVFGRICTHFGGMPGRREFSEPQFYRAGGGRS